MKIFPRNELDIQRLLHSRRRAPHCQLAWLGQAGFVLRLGKSVVVVDPYLSDSLAGKYRGTLFSHERLMQPPIAAEKLAPLDAILCTHGHTDHLDPGTLAILADRNPGAVFVVPRALRELAIDRGVPRERMVAMNAGEHTRLAPDLSVCAVASAHEDLRRDNHGNHHFLGYVMGWGNTVVYHSGDCVPYPGLTGQLAALAIHLAILPVNGRDEHRRQNGVPGNFTFAEAASLCLSSGISAMFACHFGMFAFNTVDEASLDRQIATLPDVLQCVRPRPGKVYELRASPLPLHSNPRSARRTVS